MPEPVQKKPVERDEVVEEATRYFAQRGATAPPKGDKRTLISVLVGLSLIPAGTIIAVKFVRPISGTATSR